MYIIVLSSIVSPGPDLPGNSVVLSVAVLGIVSAGVHHTGVIDFIFMRHWVEPVALSSSFCCGWIWTILDS